ncbi:hypothetical protein DPEC_G00335910 [Dallia pectoralis]|uniref:Uncharacterized protein n=1 Tax=Dallia pectoralis TaxID=75939 RepID=A0ACC2F723_DALPE|nr:hypothetical protein DPEC_G00335910 [Dallia pectoralis]
MPVYRRHAGLPSPCRFTVAMPVYRRHAGLPLPCRPYRRRRLDGERGRRADSSAFSIYSRLVDTSDHPVGRVSRISMALLMENQFRELPADRAIDTKLFLESVAYLPPFFDCLGSKVFAPIKSDISGNITKIRGVYEKDPVKYATLQKIVEAEKEEHGTGWPKVGATLALMWLKRGLLFIQVLLRSLADGEKDVNNPNLIRVNITKAYDRALKRYHGWIVQKIFKAALLAAPYKSEFIKALSKGQEVTEADCMASVCQFLVNYTATVDAIYEMYTTLNAELDYTA